MNQEHTPKWLDSMSSEPAPQVPGEFLVAVRNRRRQRVRTLAATWTGVTAVVALTVVAWVAGQSGNKARPRQIADGPVAPVPTFEAPEPGLAVTSVFGEARDLELDRLASTASGDRQMRIGDHWDPERVEAWVLD